MRVQGEAVLELCGSGASERYSGAPRAHTRPVAQSCSVAAAAIRSTQRTTAQPVTLSLASLAFCLVAPAASDTAPFTVPAASLAFSFAEPRMPCGRAGPLAAGGPGGNTEGPAKRAAGGAPCPRRLRRQLCPVPCWPRWRLCPARCRRRPGHCLQVPVRGGGSAAPSRLVSSPDAPAPLRKAHP